MAKYLDGNGNPIVGNKFYFNKNDVLDITHVAGLSVNEELNPAIFSTYSRRVGGTTDYLPLEDPEEFTKRVENTAEFMRAKMQLLEEMKKKELEFPKRDGQIPFHFLSKHGISG